MTTQPDSDFWLNPPELEDEAADVTFKRDWKAVDLTDVLEGTWEPPQPTVGRRSDGVGLFYPGKVHTVASESEAGKTWFALSAVIDEIMAGNHVLYVDFEDDAGGVVGRLLALQLGAELVRERLHYVRPESALGSGIHSDDLRDLLVTYRPTLAIVDGITEAMTLHGLDPLSNKDIATFGRLIPRRLADDGPAVVCLDHVVKDREGRGRYALGGVHKLNAVDGAAFLLDNRKPFGIGLKGITTIRIAKDRPGQLRKHGVPNAQGVWFADLTLDSHDEAFAEVEVVPAEKKATEEFRPTAIMGKICEAIEDKGPLSGAKINALVTGKATTIRQAISLLQIDGYVSDGTPHTLLKPWDGGGSNA
ncbi:MAG: AAA family ATPase [Nocardioidaceae bacterium]|nr:AAA family ATPase [Nocardioidaceae bacterium]